MKKIFLILSTVLISSAALAVCNDQNCPCACHKEKAAIENIVIEIAKPIVESTQKAPEKEVQEIKAEEIKFETTKAQEEVKETKAQAEPIKEVQATEEKAQETPKEEIKEIPVSNVEQTEEQTEKQIEEQTPEQASEEISTPEEAPVAEEANASEEEYKIIDENKEETAKTTTKCDKSCKCGCHKKIKFKKIKCNCNK